MRSLTYEESVFNRAHSDKHFSELYKMSAKSTVYSVDEFNCVASLVFPFESHIELNIHFRALSCCAATFVFHFFSFKRIND